jgi:hypothetical protein
VFLEGSVILLGSLSDLMNQGSAGHAKALCREVRRCSGLFQGSATVVPFIPPPIFGTNDTSLIMAISDVTNWLDSVQAGNFMDYISALGAQILASIWEKNPESQQEESIEYPPHKQIFPDNVGLHNDKIFELPGEPDLPKSLPPMSAESESALYKPLFEGLNVLFKWDIDTTPSISRDTLSTNQNPPTHQIPSIMIGGSNASRLREAMGHMGKEVVDITSGGWFLTPTNLQTVKCLIQAECDTKPDSPVIIYRLDNSCFMCLTAAGQLTPITKSTEDNKYHVDGDLAITPPILLKPMFETLSEIVAICGSRLIYILTPLPWYVLVPCCFKDSHCASLIVKDDATRQVVLGLMDELDQVCRLVKTKFPSCKVINTGDLLAGKDGASKLEVSDAMIVNWMTDPVHGDKAGYARVAVKPIEKMEEKPITQPPTDCAGSSGSAGSIYCIRLQSRPWPRFQRHRSRGGEAGLFSLATPTIRAGLTAATAGTDGILPPTNSQEVATAADAAVKCPSHPPLASGYVYSGHLFFCPRLFSHCGEM